MTKNLHRLGVLLLLIFQINAYGQETTMSEAHQYLQNKQLEEAKKAYLELEESGLESKTLYYNLGIVYYELEAYPESILYFEKARVIDPGNKDIRHNLALANRKTENDFIRVEDFFLKRWWNSFSDFFSMSQWTTLIILFSILIAISFYFYLFAQTDFAKKMGMRSFYPMLIALLILVRAGYTKYGHLNDHSFAILLEQNVLYEGPDERSESTYELRSGTKIKIIDQLNSWLKVELINKERGWVKNEGIGII